MYRTILAPPSQGKVTAAVIRARIPKQVHLICPMHIRVRQRRTKVRAHRGRKATTGPVITRPAREVHSIGHSRLPKYNTALTCGRPHQKHHTETTHLRSRHKHQPQAKVIHRRLKRQRSQRSGVPRRKDRTFGGDARRPITRAREGRRPTRDPARGHPRPHPCGQPTSQLPTRTRRPARPQGPGNNNQKPRHTKRRPAVRTNPKPRPSQPMSRRQTVPRRKRRPRRHQRQIT